MASSWEINVNEKAAGRARCAYQNQNDNRGGFANAYTQKDEQNIHMIEGSANIKLTDKVSRKCDEANEAEKRHEQS